MTKMLRSSQTEGVTLFTDTLLCVILYLMYSPEEIKQEHDMPDAEVTPYGEPTTIEGLEVAAFTCREEGEESIIIATQQGEAITTSRYDQHMLMEFGGGDFHQGVMAAMKRQVYAHYEDLILPD